MISYHVFFSAKSESEEQRLINATHALAAELTAARKISSHRFLRTTQSTSFPELPRFQLIIDCTDQAALDQAIAHIGAHVHEGPHGEIVRLVGAFKVSFSTDV